MATSVRTDSAHSPGRVNSEILDRLPPQNLDAELGVLGSLLLDPQLCDEIALMLRPGDRSIDGLSKWAIATPAFPSRGARSGASLSKRFRTRAESAPEARLHIERLRREAKRAAAAGARIGLGDLT